MEKLKVKHDHKLTDIIKVCIFALFLILPILCFLPTGLYYGFNEHATNTETTTINYKYQSNEVNTVDDLIIGNIYELNINYSSIDDYFLAGTDYLKLEVISVLEYDFSNYNFSIEDTVTNISNSEYENVKLIFEIADDALGYFDLYFSPLDSDYIIDTLVGTLTDEPFTFKCIGKIIDGSFSQSEYEIFSYSDYNVIESVDINTDDTISNKMYQAWQGLWQSPLYNWTDNNNFQFTINAFTNVFGITQQSYITNYLNYLLSITAIYVVFDIVLAMFKWLTHLIGEK